MHKEELLLSSSKKGRIVAVESMGWGETVKPAHMGGTPLYRLLPAEDLYGNAFAPKNIVKKEGDRVCRMKSTRRL